MYFKNKLPHVSFYSYPPPPETGSLQRCLNLLVQFNILNLSEETKNAEIAMLAIYLYPSRLISVSDSFVRPSINQHYFAIMPLTFSVISLCNKIILLSVSMRVCLALNVHSVLCKTLFEVWPKCGRHTAYYSVGCTGTFSSNKDNCQFANWSLTEGVALPGVLLRVLKVLGDEGKVLAQFQPQVRLWHPAIVGVDGMVLGQLPCD